MIFRKTSSTKIKKVFINKYDRKEPYLIRTTTYWLLFIPIYQKESDIV